MKVLSMLLPLPRVAVRFSRQRFPLVRNVGTAISMASESVPALLPASAALEFYNLKKPVKFVDGSWHLDKSRNGFTEYLHESIPGASYFDIDEAAVKDTNLPHMIPTEEHMSDYISGLGVSSEDHVIVYASDNCFSSARVWWTFRLFGHDKVSIMNGGLPSWKSLGGPVLPGSADKPERREFQAKLQSPLISSSHEVLDIVNTGAAQLLDARSEARFLAQAPEPRPGLPGGHIPGSLNLPFGALLEPDDVTKFRSVPELRAAFEQAGIVPGSRVVTTCGSGVTASVLLFGLHLIGVDLSMLSVYDGSWTEWASDKKLPRVP